MYKNKHMIHSNNVYIMHELFSVVLRFQVIFKAIVY